MWLVKVPVAVAEAIKNAQEGEKVGTLTVSRSGGGGEELVSLCVGVCVCVCV